MARELHDLMQLIDRRCLDVLQPDAIMVCGMSGLVRIGRIAQRRALSFTPHSWEGFGLRSNAQLAVGIGGCPYLEFPTIPWAGQQIDGFRPASADRHRPGRLADLPDAPGLGLEPDHDRLAPSCTSPAAADHDCADHPDPWRAPIARFARPLIASGQPNARPAPPLDWRGCF